VISLGVPKAEQHVLRSGDDIRQQGTPVRMTATHVPLTTTVVPITSHQEPVMIRTLSQSARPPPLIARTHHEQANRFLQ
jgi:hypothetical protein